jgi:hypothetical protein
MEPEVEKTILQEVQDLMESGDEAVIYQELVELKKDLYQKKKMIQDMDFHEVADVIDKDVEMTVDHEERDFGRRSIHKKWEGTVIAEIDYIIKIPLSIQYEVSIEEDGVGGKGSDILSERPAWISQKEWREIEQQVVEDLDKWDWKEEQY